MSGKSLSSHTIFPLIYWQYGILLVNWKRYRSGNHIYLWNVMDGPSQLLALTEHCWPDHSSTELSLSTFSAATRWKAANLIVLTTAVLALGPLGQALWTGIARFALLWGQLELNRDANKGAILWRVCGKSYGKTPSLRNVNFCYLRDYW